MTIIVAEGTKPSCSSDMLKSSSAKTFRGNVVIMPNGMVPDSLPCFICTKSRTAANCSFLSKVSVNDVPFGNRI